MSLGDDQRSLTERGDLDSVTVSEVSQSSADGNGDGPGGAARGEGGTLIAIYRTLPARVIGWAMIVAVGAVGYIVIRGELALGRDVFFAVASLCFVIVVAWIFLLRPSVELRSESVTQRNILRDTVVPFCRLQNVTYQWALELIDTGGRKHSSWAIPKQREFSLRRGFDNFAETTARKKAKPGPTAQAVAGDVLREHQRWLLDGGKLDTSTSTSTSTELGTGTGTGNEGETGAGAGSVSGERARWAVSAVAPLGLSVLALVIAIATDGA